MRCPYCGFTDQKVLDSRPSPDAEVVRRRRECGGCGRRFTTIERCERQRIFVVKRDGSREEFNKEKIFESMRIACRKRPISVEALRHAVECIERSVFQEHEDEVTSRRIGERVMNQLAQLDTVAYVRFASVYQEFETLDDFMRMAQSLESSPTPELSRS